MDNVSAGGVADIKSDIDLKNSYNIINSKTNTIQELKNERKLVNFEDVRENFVGMYEAFPMKTYLDMGTNYIYNVKTPIRGGVNVFPQCIAIQSNIARFS